MSGFKGDFLGFTYNGVHSSDLGIVRTSDGSRFNENLLPTIQDKTVQVPGGDGTYFYGSYYTQRQFSVGFAFDNLNEEQVRNLRSRFGDKKIHELIFDENPYKIYQAKVTGTAQIKHLVFDEGEGRERIYKGDGTVQFTCYQPYALCKNKWLQEYRSEYTNVDEWAAASGLKESQGDYDKVQITGNGGYINLYNPGDIDTHFRLRADFSPNGQFQEGSATLNNDETSKTISWRAFTRKVNDSYVVFDTQTNLVEGFNAEGKKTGNLYNQYITGGSFFKIPQGESMLMFNDMEISTEAVSIDYNYWYI